MSALRDYYENFKYELTTSDMEDETETVDQIDLTLEELKELCNDDVIICEVEDDEDEIMTEAVPSSEDVFRIGSVEARRVKVQQPNQNNEKNVRRPQRAGNYAGHQYTELISMPLLQRRSVRMAEKNVPSSNDRQEKRQKRD